MTRSLFFVLVLGACSPALSQSAGGAAAGRPDTVWTISRCVNAFTSSRIESTKAGYQYWFADKSFLDGRTLKLSVVRPHAATHAPHTHGEDEFFFVLEGKAQFFLNGDSVEVGPMTSLYCPPDSYHGIRNAGDAELKYLVIKKYPLVTKQVQQRP
jgi:mannose-6-phosphate isomerase-like protein (cupin superfamily)